MDQQQLIELGNRIRDLRKSKGLSGADLAKRSGMGQSTISAIESGKHATSIESVFKICHGLGIELSEFFSTDTPADVLQLKELACQLSPEERVLFIDLMKAFLRRTTGPEDSEYSPPNQ